MVELWYRFRSGLQLTGWTLEATKSGKRNFRMCCFVIVTFKVKRLFKVKGREEILGSEAFAVDKTVVIVRTVVIPSDTRAGDASRWVVLVVTWSRGHVTGGDASR